MNGRFVLMGSKLIVEDGVELRRVATFACPFCDEHLSAYSTADMEVRALVHTIPYCDTFGRFEVNEFLREAAKKLGLNNEGAN